MNDDSKNVEQADTKASPVERLVMPLHEEILSLLRKRAEMDYEYINPNFLTQITGIISDYYQLDDDDVDSWIADMYGA